MPAIARIRPASFSRSITPFLLGLTLFGAAPVLTPDADAKPRKVKKVKVAEEVTLSGDGRKNG